MQSTQMTIILGCKNASFTLNLPALYLEECTGGRSKQSELALVYLPRKLSCFSAYGKCQNKQQPLLNFIYNTKQWKKYTKIKLTGIRK